MTIDRITLALAFAVSLASCGKKDAAPATGSNQPASAPANGRAFTFHITEPSGTRDVVVTKPVIHIGRVQSSEVLMTDDSLGRSVSMIEDDKRGVTYTDLGSGTTVDGTQLLGKDTLLKSGAVIELGKSKIVVTF